MSESMASSYLLTGNKMKQKRAEGIIRSTLHIYLREVELFTENNDPNYGRARRHTRDIQDLVHLLEHLTNNNQAEALAYRNKISHTLRKTLDTAFANLEAAP